MNLKSPKKFKRVLVANRGEIAVRIIRTLQLMGIESVALFSSADQDSYHLKICDFAYYLPGASVQETYLNQDLVVKAIKETQVDAVHPGYGFLSENAEFARLVATKTDAKFIGPSAKVIELMGSKTDARKFLKIHKIPIVDGLEEPLENFASLEKASQRLSFPLILKASEGGGGRGMQIIKKPQDLKKGYEKCKRESLAYFGSENIYCEKYIESPRHIEVQIIRDSQGNCVHLFERECSIQRKHQKIVEESPSPFLSNKERGDLGQVAVRIANLCDYEGVGTCEFIFDSQKKFYFIEMNTRIQVEHPVSEQITGIDLVQKQIEIAQGQSIDMSQDEIKICGHSIELRVNAEDPANHFIPSTGEIKSLTLPHSPNIRIDTHIYQGLLIGSDFDSLLAKIIGFSKTREECVHVLKQAMGEMSIEGVQTNKNFLEKLLVDTRFVEGNYNTHFLDKMEDSSCCPTAAEASIAAILGSRKLST